MCEREVEKERERESKSKSERAELASKQFCRALCMYPMLVFVTLHYASV